MLTNLLGRAVLVAEDALAKGLRPHPPEGEIAGIRHKYDTYYDVLVLHTDGKIVAYDQDQVTVTDTSEGDT